ncbi:MAG: hypothetical protein JXB03_01050, partial [Spirochaetales bacterium]|nr:hypothetical protein [Spirochaetales bacterium]
GVSSTTPLGGKIPESAAKFVANSGIVAGKRCFAFVLKTGIRTGATLSKMMAAMEHEGMFLKYSHVLSSNAEAVAVGKRLHVQ